MSTRRAKPGRVPKPERFASSAALRKPILANLVQRRCEALRDPADLDLVLWLQAISLLNPCAPHPLCPSFPSWPFPCAQPVRGGLEQLAVDFCERYKDQLTGNVDRVRTSIPAFVTSLCLDPHQVPAVATLKGFPGIVEALREFRRAFNSAAAWRIARTSVSEEIWSVLDYCASQRGMVVLEGQYRCGKTVSVSSWCLAHSGFARYVSLNALLTDTDFFRAIARSLGTASCGQMKAMEVRMRIEDALRGTRLMLCFDEGEHLFAPGTRPQCAPERVNWLMTAAANHGIPVAITAGRNFSRLLANYERRLPTWGAEQLRGRIMLHKQLPGNLTEADLFAVARLLIPEGDHTTHMLLVGHALTAAGRVASLEHAAKRARFFAERQGRAVVFEDVELALDELKGAAAFMGSNSRASRDLSAALPPGTRAATARHLGRSVPVALTLPPQPR